MKIIFFGTAEFGIETLKLISKNHTVLKVVTGEMQKSGRGYTLTKNPIHLLAESLKLNILNRKKPTIEDVQEEFDIGVVVAYGAIISKEIIEKAKYGFLNLHPSDLPKFRGASPIERTLEAGEQSTRVCIIKMTPKLDDGDIVTFQNYQIQPSQNSIDLHKEFSIIGAKLMLEATSLIAIKNNFTPQNHLLATYAKKITKHELLLKSKELSFQEIENKVKAFASYGYPFILHEGKIIKIRKVIFSPTQLSSLDITCLNGFAVPVEIKPEGKNWQTKFI